MHLLWSCPKAQQFWNDVKLVVGELCDKNDTVKMLSWNLKEIIYNVVHPKPNHVINLIVCLAKFAIFRSKCEKSVVNIMNFKYEIGYNYRIELFNAIRSDGVNKHEEKWKNINLQYIRTLY